MAVGLPAGHKPLAGLLDRKQSCCTSSQKHDITWATVCQLILGPSQHLLSQRLCLMTSVKILQFLVQFIRMWNGVPGQRLLFMIALNWTVSSKLAN